MYSSARNENNDDEDKTSEKKKSAFTVAEKRYTSFLSPRFCFYIINYFSLSQIPTESRGEDSLGRENRTTEKEREIRGGD